MNRSIRSFFFSEFMLWFLLGVFAVYCIWPLRQKIRLGIDLVGGTYLTLQVDTRKAIESDLVSKLQAIDGMLNYAHAKLPKEKIVAADSLLLTFSDVATCQKAAPVIKKEWPDVTISTADATLTIKHTRAVADRLADDAVQRNVEVLRTRIDKFSVAEIPISRQGADRISIELPDVQDPQKAKELIGRTAALDFRIVYKIAGSEDDILFDLEGEIPFDREILPGNETEQGRVFYLVEKYPQVTGKMLKKARPGLGGRLGNEPVVQFEFDTEGGDKFYELTSKNYGKQLAIVLDGEVISAPRISVAIRNSGEIQGNFQPEETRSLALLLQSGSFVAPVSFVEERQIGPSLGEASIRSGMISCIVGLVLLFFFSIIIYKFSGFLSFLSLLYNLILLLAGLVWIQATLTLPGIAGILLTIGMAIDASILIFEQIRDEIRGGISPKVAVQKGFSDAMAVILDANITTFLVGVVLYNVGSGPVQGFAITLMIGIMATLVSALMFLRSVFALFARFSSMNRLSI